jgi:hypothetical protein
MKSELASLPTVEKSRPGLFIVDRAVWNKNKFYIPTLGDY